jgi:hypothetical protein
MKEKLQYILQQLKINNYTILPETISTGIVYKIDYPGNLDIQGYERGFLIMTKGSSIKQHEHTENVERYKVIMGKLIIKGKEHKENICLIGESHSIDKVKELTIIETYKMDKKLLKQEEKIKK